MWNFVWLLLTLLTWFLLNGNTYVFYVCFTVEYILCHLGLSAGSFMAILTDLSV